MAWPKSLRWRFSLRALFVFITLFMLWGGFHAGRSWPERRAELVLKRHGASIRYGLRQPTGGLFSYPKFAYWKLVQLLWGERFIDHVTLFGVPQPDAVDALTALPHLESFSVEADFLPRVRLKLARQNPDQAGVPRQTIPDGTLERILASRSFRGIILEGVELGESDLQALSCHQSLEEVCFCRAGVSEDALADIATLPRLRYLRFAHCNLTGDKLASVPGSPILDFIECPESPVGTEFAMFVARCPNLRHLAFLGDDNMRIDDTFIAALGPHPSLHALDLRLTKVTDASIDTIASMPALTSVILPRETVTPSAMQRLQKMRPNLQVSSY